MGKLHKKITKFTDKYDLGRKAGQAVVGKDRERKLYDQGHFIGNYVESQYDATKAAESAARNVASRSANPSVSVHSLTGTSPIHRLAGSRQRIR